MLLREVLSDTHQPSSVEAADQQEHCSLSLKSGRAGSVATSILIASSYKMEQISADFHLISRLSGSHLNCHSYKSH